MLIYIIFQISAIIIVSYFRDPDDENDDDGDDGVQSLLSLQWCHSS